jgi:ATP-dependent helicase/nuclease subunit A
MTSHAAEQLEMPIAQPDAPVAARTHARVASQPDAPAPAEYLTPALEPPAERHFTEEQQLAVERRQGSLLLAAGAGSGKTAVLVERFVRAVLDDGVAPGRILAITFTERAAGELAERVRTRFVQLGRRDCARETEAAFIGTFHGFCARLLRAHPALAELDPEFSVLDESQAGRLRLAAFRGALADLLARDGAAAVDLVAAFGADRLRACIFNAHAQLRSQGQLQPTLPPALPLLAGADVRAGVQARALLNGLLRDFGAAYSELKRRRGGVDFDDLELLALVLLREHGDVRAAWSERFALLMVDEFQDTNPRQLALVQALARENLFTVGDELQSIYGFRHADVGLFRARAQQLAARGDTLALTHNFRSRPPLLAAINAVFATRFGPAYRPLRAGRAGEEGGGGRDCMPRTSPIELLLSDRRAWNGDSGGEGLAVLSGELPAAPRWRHAEARLLAQRIAEIVAHGQARAGEVAVLLRALGDLPVYQRALEQQGLATLAGVGSFWGQQQVADLVAYLRLLANPLDEPALYGTLASPLVGLSSDALVHIARVAHAAGGQPVGGSALPVHVAHAVGGQPVDGSALPGGDPQGGLGARPSAAGELGIGGHGGPPGGGGVWETLRLLPAELHTRLREHELQRLQRFIEHFQAERAHAHARPLAELLLRVLHGCAYEIHLLALPDGERRLANVHKLLRLARRFEASEGRELRGFLDYVEHARSAAEGAAAEPEAPLSEQQGDAVRLLSVHAAKGLEFPIVCLADLGRAPRALTPDLLLHEQRLGIRLPQLDGSAPQPTLDYEELLHERRAAEAAEEERIVYVAATRARERLLLSGAVDFQRWPAAQPGGAPIAWLAPLLNGEIPALAGEAAVCAVHEELPVAGAPGVSMRCVLNTPATLGTALRACAPNVAASPLGVAAPSPPSAATPPPSSIATPPPLPPTRLAHTSSVHLAAPAARRTRTQPLPPNHIEPELSYTSLSERERCGYRYYLEHVLRLPEDRSALQAGGRLQGRMRGILIHRVMQSIDFSAPRAPAPRELARLAGELGLAPTPAERAELLALLAAALRSPLMQRLAAAPQLRREYPFAFALARAEPLVTGTLDVLAREPDGAALVLDYKSDRLHEHEDMQALTERDYGAQRLIYALAALRDGAARVEVVHWFMQRPSEPVSASFTAAQRPQLEMQLRQRAARAHAAGYAVSATPHRRLCLTCPGRATLCTWSSAETLRASVSIPAQLQSGRS